MCSDVLHLPELCEVRCQRGTDHPKKPVELHPRLSVLLLERDVHVADNLRLEDCELCRVLRELLHLVKLRCGLVQLVQHLDLLVDASPLLNHASHVNDDLKAVARVVVILLVDFVDFFKFVLQAEHLGYRAVSKRPDEGKNNGVREGNRRTGAARR